jgi:hypothetical protein
MDPKSKLLQLQDRILTWPQSVPEYAPDEDPDIVFDRLYNELEELMSTFVQMDENDRKEMDAALRDFQARMQAHYDNVQKQLEAVSSGFGDNLQYLKAAKAYGPRL